jgi:hypothetical protein
MSCVRIQELELLSFFEVQPSVADPEVPWPYNDYAYQVSVGPYSVHFRIAPAYRDVSLSVALDGNEFYRFRSLAVSDVLYHKDSDRETLEIRVSERESIWLRLRPSVLIAQDMGEA